jgi:TetR/AcrR family transcriptional regulator, cholesterol catabolism regulator
MEKEQLILLEQITQLFLRFGIRSLTMDDIARELGISKKTLYRYFEDKKDLVRKVIEIFIEFDKGLVLQLRDRKVNAVDEMMEICTHISQKITEVHPSVFYDLQKYHADAWKIYNDYKQDFIFNCIAENIRKGIEEGFYRENLNVEIIAKLYISRIDLFINPELFPPGEISFKNLIFEAIKYHVFGIASEKGAKYLNKKLKTLE